LLDPEASPAGESFAASAPSAPPSTPEPEQEAQTTPTTAPEPEPVQEAPFAPVQSLTSETTEPAVSDEVPSVAVPPPAEIEPQSEPPSPDVAPSLPPSPAAETLIDDSDLDEPEAVPARIDDSNPDPTAEATLPDTETEADVAEDDEDGEDCEESDAPAEESDDTEDAPSGDAEESGDDDADTEEDNETAEASINAEPESPAEPAPVEPAASEPAPAPELAFDLEPTPAISAEPALTNDGYTRLIATAYIGIGNKLFIRGDGPGLRRDKGVPLQFISIGKWRWESAELLFPVKAKLYKNDQLECTALGEVTLEPGHHHEVNATF
jgi:hypothetical protein